MTSTTKNGSNVPTYREKLSLSATTLSTLYLLPVAAQAGVVSVTTPLTISIPDARAFDYSPVDWDVDGNTVADFRLEAFRTVLSSGDTPTYSGGYTRGSSRPSGDLQLNSGGLAGQGMVQNVGDNAEDLQNLAIGSKVGRNLAAGRQWGPNTNTNRILMTSYSYSAFTAGNLFGAGNFIGFSFQGDTGQTLYGWAELSLDEVALSMTIDQWAYEDSGNSIRVGQISSVPLPPAFLTMLSGLALGAGGLLRGRRLRKAAQDKGMENSC